MTTLTRSAILKTGKPRFAWVEIEGLGMVGINAVSQFKTRSRQATYYDSSGAMLPQFYKNPAHQIIDQLYETETKPMFTDADIDLIEEMDTEIIARIIKAIEEFNEDTAKNDLSELPTT